MVKIFLWVAQTPQNDYLYHLNFIHMYQYLLESLTEDTFRIYPVLFRIKKGLFYFIQISCVEVVSAQALCAQEHRCVRMNEDVWRRTYHWTDFTGIDLCHVLTWYSFLIIQCINKKQSDGGEAVFQKVPEHEGACGAYKLELTELNKLQEDGAGGASEKRRENITKKLGGTEWVNDKEGGVCAWTDESSPLKTFYSCTLTCIVASNLC